MKVLGRDICCQCWGNGRR